MALDLQTYVDPTLSPLLYTPNYDFLRYTLGKKTQQYEKGLAQVSSAYAGLKKDLTDPVNIQRRDQYLKNADAQLRKLASADLSLQENVNAAQSLFEPMVSDKAFMYDAYYTEVNKRELAKLDAWASSEDAEERKKFNPELQAWLRRDLDSIRNGKGKVENYKVQGRTALAYVDPQEILVKAAKDQGFEYKIDSFGQPYIITTEGGPGGERNYRVFSENVLKNDPLYQRQIKALGENDVETALEMYKTKPEWANVPATEIYKDFAKNRYADTKKQDENYLQSLQQSLVKDRAGLNAFVNANKDAIVKGEAEYRAGNTSGANVKTFMEFAQKAGELTNLTEQLDGRKQEFNQMYSDPKSMENYINSFANSPKAMMMDERFKNDITRFSNIRSASIERKIKKDDAYVDILVAKTNALALASKMQDQMADNLRADVDLNRKITKDEFEMALKGQKLVKKADGTTEIVSGSDAGIVPIDVSATQIRSYQALQKLKDDVSMASAAALNSMTAAGYGAFSLLESMGMKKDRVGVLRDLYTREWNKKEGEEIALNGDEADAFVEAYDVLDKFASNNPNNKFKEKDAERNKTALKVREIPDMIEDAVSGFTPTDNVQIQAMDNINEFREQAALIEKTKKTLEVGKKALIAQLKTKGGDFSKLVVERTDGKGKKYDDLVDENDFAENIKEVVKLTNVPSQYKYDGLKIYVNGELKNSISDAEAKNLSNQYYFGELIGHKLSRNYNVSPHYYYENFKTSDGKTYEIQYSAANKNARPFFPMNMNDFQNIMKRANQDFELQIDDVVGSPFYGLKGDTRETVLRVLNETTQTNSTIWEYADGTAEPKMLDDAKEIREIRAALLKEGEISKEGGVNFYTSSPLSRGGQAISVQFLPNSSENAPAYQGKTYYFPITPTAASDKLFQVFADVRESSEFEDYKSTGKTYTYDVFKGAGVYAEITPNQKGSNTGTLVIYEQAFDPISKTYSGAFTPVTSSSGLDNLMVYDLSKITFPEMKNKLRTQIILPYVQKRAIFNKQVQATSGTTQPGGLKLKDIETIKSELGIK